MVFEQKSCVFKGFLNVTRGLITVVDTTVVAPFHITSSYSFLKFF